MMKKGESKLSQFVAVVLLILFFIFSMLYLMLFQTVNDIMRATLSVNQKMVALRCDGILNSFLSAEYYKPTNDHLNVLECSDLGVGYFPYNETYCINIQNRTDKQVGVYRAEKVNSFIVGSWYETPQLVLTPRCEEVDDEFYILIVKMYISPEDFEDLLYVDYLTAVRKSHFDSDSRYTLSRLVGGQVLLDTSSYNMYFKEDGGSEVPYIDATYDMVDTPIRISHTTKEDFSCLPRLDPPVHEILTAPLRYNPIESLTTYAKTRGEVLNAFKVRDYLVYERPIKLCTEFKYGECGDIGIKLPKENYYYYVERIEKLKIQLMLNRGSTSASGDIIKGAMALPRMSVGMEYCETPVFSIEQIGDSIRKGILDSKAYIMWG